MVISLKASLWLEVLVIITCYWLCQTWAAPGAHDDSGGGGNCDGDNDGVNGIPDVVQGSGGVDIEEGGGRQR